MTPGDARAGFGFAAVPGPVYHSLFAAKHTRTYIHATGWEATLQGRRDSTGELFRADSNALTIPPSQRPGDSPDTRATKRQRTDATKTQDNGGSGVGQARLLGTCRPHNNTHQPDVAGHGEAMTPPS